VKPSRQLVELKATHQGPACGATLDGQRGFVAKNFWYACPDRAFFIDRFIVNSYGVI
jgi:hypothetical protein